MYTFSFYVFTLLITVGLGWLFNLDQFDPTSIFSYILAVLALVLGLVLSFLFQILTISIYGELRKKSSPDNRLNHKYANAILRFGLHIARVKLVLTGEENIPEHNKFIFMANHQENYDIIVIKPIFKNHTLDFIAKESVMKLPVFGKWIKILGNVPIGRYSDRSAAKSIIQGIRLDESGIPMAIFPEGKRSFSNEMIDFKAGAFKLAMKPKANILIGTIYNFSKILKQWPWKKQTVYVHIHPLLTYEEYEGLNSHELSDKVREIIQIKLDEFEETIGS